MAGEGHHRAIGKQGMLARHQLLQAPELGHVLHHHHTAASSTWLGHGRDGQIDGMQPAILAAQRPFPRQAAPRLHFGSEHLDSVHRTPQPGSQLSTLLLQQVWLQQHAGQGLSAQLIGPVGQQLFCRMIEQDDPASGIQRHQRGVRGIEHRQQQVSRRRQARWRNRR